MESLPYVFSTTNKSWQRSTATLPLCSAYHKEPCQEYVWIGALCNDTKRYLGGETRGPYELVLSRRALGQKQLFCISFIFSKLIYGWVNHISGYCRKYLPVVEDHL